MRKASQRRTAVTRHLMASFNRAHPTFGHAIAPHRMNFRARANVSIWYLRGCGGKSSAWLDLGAPLTRVQSACSGSTPSACRSSSTIATAADARLAARHGHAARPAVVRSPSLRKRMADLLDRQTARRAWPIFSVPMVGQHGRYQRIADPGWSEEFDCQPFWHRVAEAGTSDHRIRHRARPSRRTRALPSDHQLVVPELAAMPRPRTRKS